MHIDIKTIEMTPLRQTFKHVAKRIGEGKRPTRYQEATFDLQPTTNFHYRPYWDPEHELYDKGRTAIKMEDWYAFRDPRQFYYATWTITRSKQQDSTERNFRFVEKRNLLDVMSDDWRQKVIEILIPLRHVEYGANLNNFYMTSYAYGSAVTQMTAFAGMDRLGIAQCISRIGLILDGNSGEVLTDAKQAWLNNPLWQPMREMVEDMLVIEDWFELFIAQNFILDGMLYPLIYDHMDKAISENGGSALAMLTEFMSEWFTESKRWVDAMLKTAAKESDTNKAQLELWSTKWLTRVNTVLCPIAEHAFGSNAEQVMNELQQELKLRANKKCALTI